MLPPSALLRIEPADNEVSRSRGAYESASARFAVDRVLAVLGAVLHQLEPVGVVAPVLAGDVVAVLALLASQGDLRTDVGGCHGALLALWGPALADRTCRRAPARSCNMATGPRGPGCRRGSGDPSCNRDTAVMSRL